MAIGHEVVEVEVAVAEAGAGATSPTGKTPSHGAVEPLQLTRKVVPRPAMLTMRMMSQRMKNVNRSNLIRIAIMRMIWPMKHLTIGQKRKLSNDDPTQLNQKIQSL